jgi:precorrin-6B methylase 2
MAAQARAPERYAKNARVAELGAPVVDLLAPKPRERILDLGCGDGALTLTLKLVQLGCKAVRVDSSPERVAAAQRLADYVRLRFTATKERR